MLGTRMPSGVLGLSDPDVHPIDYVQTHCDGGYFAKWSCAVGAFFSMLFLVCRHPRAVLHVHAASRRSFWRKAVLMTVARLAGWPIVFELNAGQTHEVFGRAVKLIEDRADLFKHLLKLETGQPSMIVDMVQYGAALSGLQYCAADKFTWSEIRAP